MKKIISLTLLLLGGSILSCLLLMTGCIKQQDAFFIYTKITSGINNRNSDSAIIAPPETIEHNLFEIVVNTSVQKSGDFSSILKFDNAAHAFQFSSPYHYKNADPITAIKIITLGDYNERYTSGSDIAAICNYAPLYYESDFSTAEIIEQLNYNTIDDRLSDNPIGLENFSIKISEPPTETRLQRFEIIFQSSNNTTLKDTTVSVFIKP